jgi:hypothetical protein
VLKFEACDLNLFLYIFGSHFRGTLASTCFLFAILGYRLGYFTEKRTQPAGVAVPPAGGAVFWNRTPGNQPYAPPAEPPPPDRPHYWREPLSFCKHPSSPEQIGDHGGSRVRHKRWRRSTEAREIRDRRGLVSLQLATCPHSIETSAGKIDLNTPL